MKSMLASPALLALERRGARVSPLAAAKFEELVSNAVKKTAVPLKYPVYVLRGTGPAGDCAWRGWARTPSATTNSQRIDRSECLIKLHLLLVLPAALIEPPGTLSSSCPGIPASKHPRHGSGGTG